MKVLGFSILVDQPELSLQNIPLTLPFVTGTDTG